MAAMALLTFSCTVTEVEKPNFTSSTLISLNPNTASTRATISDLGTLIGDANGFVVYADTTGGTAWFPYIDGTNNHAYTSGNWRFLVQSVQWPFTGYPMYFWAYYPSSSPSITSINDTYPDIEFDVEIQLSKDDQEDLLIAFDSATVQPPTGVLPLRFRHILSKVNFTFEVELGDTAYVLAVGFDNLFKENTYSVTDTAWAPLVYGTNALDSFNYFNDFKPLASGPFDPEIMFEGQSPTIKDSIFKGVAGQSAHLMLLPQDPDMWVVTGSRVLPGDSAYIRMLYRLKSPLLEDSIGYEYAQNHPGYTGSALDVSFGYTGPLYVLAGYTYDGEWQAGKGYNYNIPIPGTGGGILLDKFYYDDQGNQTDVEVENVDVLGHILGTDNMRLIPTVDNWDPDIDSDARDH